MKNNISIILLTFLILPLLSACSAPITYSPQGSQQEIYRETEYEKELIYQKLILDQDRVFNLSFPILKNNVEFCEQNIVPAFGMTAWSVNSVAETYRKTAHKLYGLHQGLAVQFVADKSPAEKAGIKSGDLIIAINGKKIPQGEASLKTASDYLKSTGYKGVNITLERKNKTFESFIKPVKICDSPVVLDYNSTDINAYADGQKIVISKGILRFAESDNEVALVIAHELAHNAMDHIKKRTNNTIIGGLSGLAIDAILASAGVPTNSEFGRMGQRLGSSRYSVQFEQEADYVGMYFMERAGYDSSGVANFWRRLATESPMSVSVRRDHPTSPERFIAIQRTYQEIANKIATQQPLLPNIKAD